MLRLSFIVPFYNVEPYIEECIRSLYNQDIPWDEYEVICIDDCSPDGSRAIVERLQKEYPTLKLLRTPENLRQGGARNMGLDIAQGKYIWFVDSDDYIKSNCLKYMLDLMEKEDLEMLKFTSTDQSTNLSRAQYVQYGPCTGSEFVFDAPLSEQPAQRCCSVCVELISRDLIENQHARFVEKKQYEDDDYMYSLFAAAKRVMSIDFAPYVIRYVANSTTHAKVTYRKVMDMNNQSRRMINFAPQLTIVDKRWEKLISDYVRWTCLENVLKNLFVFSFADQLRFFFFEGRIKNLRSIVGNRVWLIMNSWIAFRVLYGFNQDINLKKWNFFHKFNNRWTKLRLQPIRVFCFHQVSDTFDPNVNCRPDWISLDQFHHTLMRLKREGYIFISLSSAYEHLKHDLFRSKKYAVLTADDGLLSQYEQIKWLEANQIPITLFLNLNFVQNNTLPTHYKEYYRDKSALTEAQLSSQLYIKAKELENIHSDYVTIALHSLKHENMARKTKEEIRDDITKGENFFIDRKDFIKFYCYPFGSHSADSDAYIRSCGYISVLIDGQKNYNDASCIHRENLTI